MRRARIAARSGTPPGFAALAGRLTRGFLLCAVLDDVERRRVIKFAYDEPLARPDRGGRTSTTRPGCTEAASYHVEVAVPDEMRARTTRTGRQPHRRACWRAGPRDADRPAIHYVADAGGGSSPGLSVNYGTERGRFLVPAALVAWVIALELALPWLFADLGALATSGGPAIAVLLSSSAVFSAWCCAAASTRSCGSCSRPTGCCLARGDDGRGGRRRGRSPSAPRAARWSSDWGVGAVVAVLAAGILTSRGRPRTGGRQEPMNLPRIFRREPESLKGIRERSAVVRSAELAMPAFRGRSRASRPRGVGALPRAPGRQRLVGAVNGSIGVWASQRLARVVAVVSQNYPLAPGARGEVTSPP